MSDITHFCDLNSPPELKEAIVDHPKLRELCSKTGIKRLTAQSEEAKEIFSLFRKWLKKNFEKRRAFYVGQAAMRLKEEGVRLTMAVQSPKEYDLA